MAKPEEKRTEIVAGMPATLAALLTGVLLLGCGLLAFHGLRRVIERATPNPWTLSRIDSFVDALPALPDAVGDHGVLAFGSSPTEIGLDPFAFDRALATEGRETVTINAGMPALNPRLQALLARRVATAFRRAGKRLAVALVEVTPFQATLARRTDPWFVGVATIAESRVDDWSSFGGALRRDPGAAAELASARLFLDDLSSAELLGFVQRRFLAGTPPTWWPGKADGAQEAEAGRRALELVYRQRYPEGLHTFTLATHGYKSAYFDDTAALWQSRLPVQASEQARRRDLQWRRECCDVDGLHFAPEYLDAVRAAMVELAAVSARTFFYVMPRNRAWVRYDAGAEARLAEALASLRTSTGAPVLDLSNDERFADADFQDTTHLSPLTGTPKLSAALAHALAEALQR